MQPSAQRQSNSAGTESLFSRQWTSDLPVTSSIPQRKMPTSSCEERLSRKKEREIEVDEDRRLSRPLQHLLSSRDLYNSDHYTQKVTAKLSENEGKEVSTKPQRLARRSGAKRKADTQEVQPKKSQKKKSKLIVSKESDEEFQDLDVQEIAKKPKNASRVNGIHSGISKTATEEK